MFLKEEIKETGSFDIVVCGGGVAGVASAVSASRKGKKVLLIEKTINLGGLATNGLVNYFVPMCNGRGKQVMFGMAEEFLKLSYKYGWTNLNDSWLTANEQKQGRLCANFSPTIFSLALTKLLQEEKVTVYLDTVLDSVVIENGVIQGVVITSKSGREFIKGKFFVDATGDADLLYRAGVPTITGKNFFTYYAFGVDTASIEKYNKTKKMSNLTRWYMGGRANLYGNNHPQERKLYSGVTKEEVTEFVVENQLELLNNIKDLNPNEFDITLLPTMAQFRTTRRLDGNTTFTEDMAYEHKEDSIGVISDFDRLDFVYELPYSTMVKNGFKNIIAVGRCTSASGYGWDLARVIPPAILSGQASGEACSIALDSGKDIYDIDISLLQKNLQETGVVIHFDESLVPKDIGKIIKSEESHF